jgi:hypothetical protein
MKMNRVSRRSSTGSKIVVEQDLDAADLLERPDVAADEAPESLAERIDDESARPIRRGRSTMTAPGTADLTRNGPPT